MSEQSIPVSQIRPPVWNSRLASSNDDLKIGELAMSIQNEGLINAVNVEGPDAEGMYNLIAGSRRMRAVAALGWSEVRCTVDAPTEPSNGLIKNIVENLQRKDLTLFEQARACAKLREEKIKIKDIAQKTGLSESHVSNLAVMYKGLPTLVLKDWESQNEAATFNFLRELAAIKEPTPEATAEKQLERWEERVHLYADFNEELDTPEETPEEKDVAKAAKKPKKKTDFKVSGDTYDALFLAIKNAKLPGTALTLATLKVLKGEQESIKGVYPEPKTKK